MHISDAQLEMRTRFVGGFYGQLVSGVLWLVSAALAAWSTPRAAIIAIVVGGFFIFPLTTLLLRLAGERSSLSPDNTLYQLGAQVALVLPLSMPLLLPVARYRLTLFFPALMVLVGAHYLPFVFLYGMRMFGVLTAALVAGGILIARFLPGSFGAGAWYGGVVLLVFAVVGRMSVSRERRTTATAGQISSLAAS
ncbi:MAG: putative rane protein [Geminicoccaceae bacterium]|jgi:hypothetical protein|nr:putative rane protein [Geminicoccaceae bacterium]